ncbi:AAA family ATPase [Psychrobacter cibarius]|uniref:AAA family ATPase n=1 Tax=Psychrobacter cibarius TaxID=282669 RepID=UPI0018E00B49|nr:AAA family ATPase [Psychrobacter cibarius]
MNIIILVGAPGSGKSTYLDKLKLDGVLILNDDNLRESIFGFERTYDIRQKLYVLYIELLNEALNDKSFNKVFLDSTFFNTREMRADLFKEISKNEISDLKINVIYKKSKLEECIIRNNKRIPNRVVKEDKLIALYERLEPPSLSEKYISNIIELC